VGIKKLVKDVMVGRGKKRVGLGHFRRGDLKFTNRTVQLADEARWPRAFPAEVYAVNRAFAQAGCFQRAFEIVAASQAELARPHPLARVREAAVAAAAARPGARRLPAERSPSGNTPGGKKSSDPITPAWRRPMARRSDPSVGSVRKVLLAYQEETAELVTSEQTRADMALAEYTRAQVENHILGLELASEEGAKQDVVKQLTAAKKHHDLQVGDWKRYADALQLAVDQLRKLESGATFQYWSAAMLADEHGLGRAVRALTGFPTAKAFRLFYYNVLGRKGSRRRDLQGIQENLDIFYAPRDRPGQDDWAEPLPPDQVKGAPKTCGLDKPIDQCFLVFCMLRLGLTNRVAAALFGISVGSTSQLLNTWVPFISVSLSHFVPWQTREQVQSTMPRKFRNPASVLGKTTSARRCRIIVDATEIRIETPSDPEEAKKFFSQYKKAHTLKYLIGITPAGTISFISDGFPGSMSDDEIVEKSGILNLLQPGDSVMADRGFRGFQAFRDAGYDLVIPALSIAKGEGYGHEFAAFTADENERTYYIAQVRIHVERMMRAIKQGWGFLDGYVPVHLIPIISKHGMNIVGRMTALTLPTLAGVDYLD